MGIFGAMTTAVSGLNAQSFSLENISGNIANSRTVGFKRVDTSFIDLVPDLPPGRELSGSVRAQSRNTTTTQGDITGTSIGTNMALNGEGFFVVRERTTFAGGNPVFGGIDLYTRRGDFELDRNGYLVNGSGYYLKGLRIDPVTGDTIGSQPNVLQIGNDNLPARATTRIEYRANLPQYPLTDNANNQVGQTELMFPLVPGPVPTYSVDPRPAGVGFVPASDEAVFLDRSISGQSLTLYNAVGAPINVQMRWAKTDAAAYGGTENWNLFYLENSAAAGAAPKWRNVGTNFTFNASGQLTSPTTVGPLTVTVNGAASGPVSFDFGTGGLTQFADANGQVQANVLRQDGYASGVLDGITVGEGGRIMGNYTNGQTVAIAQVPIAQFSADNFLKRGDGGTFEQTLESGEPLITDAGNNIVGSSLENSNADIADEFSKMIVTQQAYSANTRVITTSQQMLQDVINIIR